MYKWKFRYEVPKDANRWVTIFAEDEDTARIQAVNKIVASGDSPPIEICEVVYTNYPKHK